MTEPTFCNVCGEQFNEPHEFPIDKMCRKCWKSLPMYVRSKLWDNPNRNELAAIRLFLGLKDGESILGKLRDMRRPIDRSIFDRFMQERDGRSGELH